MVNSAAAPRDSKARALMTDARSPARSLRDRHGSWGLQRVNARAGDAFSPLPRASVVNDRAYGEILARAIERDCVPRFGEHGLDAAAAWRRSASAPDRPAAPT
jgi:hypothetical protein